MAIYKNITPLISFFFLLIFPVIPSHAADKSFSWTANAEPVSGYKIHYGTSSGKYTSVVDVGLPQAVNGKISATVSGLQEGHTYYFTATAYLAARESDYSAEVFLTVPATASAAPPAAGGGPNTASSTISNTAPVTQDKSFSVDRNEAYSGQLAATDAEGDVISFSIAKGPKKGRIVMNSSGTFTYTPDSDASGVDKFTFVATDGKLYSNAGKVNILVNVAATAAANKVAFELGELRVTSEWQHVDFSTRYESPAVVAKSTTANDPATGLVTIKNLTGTGFDIRIRGWDAANGSHPEEIVSFMAMERGRHQIADNVSAVAECTGLSGVNTFQPVTFTDPFSTRPVVVSSIVTDNESYAAILRMKNITPQGFSITTQEPANSDGSHAAETACYIAMEKWSGIVDNLMVEVGTTEKVLTSTPSTVFFDQQFPTIPFVLADMQSTNSLNAAILSMSNLTITDTGMTILAKRSADSAVGQIAETGGYFAVTPYNPAEDGDNDGKPVSSKRFKAKSISSVMSLFNQAMRRP